MVDSKFITASGTTEFVEQNIDTALTGQVFVGGIAVNPGDSQKSTIGHLVSLSANFGLNLTPHKFDFQYATEDFCHETLPAIGKIVELELDGFYVKGQVVHADFARSTNGNIVTISVEDLRQDQIDNTVIDTFGIYGINDSPPSGIIDVRNFKAEEGENDTAVNRILEILDSQGATYTDIYNAINAKDPDLAERIPSPDVVAAQLDGDPDSFRWRVRAQPLLEFLNRALSDVALDFYWAMREGKIEVINRKDAVDIDTSTHILLSDIDTEPSRKFGKDKGERPTRTRVYGAQMEGLVGGGGQLETTGGGFGLDVELGVSTAFDSMVFNPAWRNASIRYFGPDGHLTIDSPTDRELAAALKGIEYWSFEKDLDNRIGRNSFSFRTGQTTRGFSPVGASGVSLVLNRANIETAWVIEWYNRIRSFATNFFGRAYSFTTSPIDIRRIDVLSEAWCNLENQSDEGSFTDGYQIADRFKFAAPFWNPQTNKLRAYAAIPGTPKWGADAKGTPANFSDYDEDDDFVYVPVEVSQWKFKQNRFQDQFLEPFNQEAGILILLPNICWEDYLTEDQILKRSAVLNVLKAKFSTNTTFDLDNPLIYGTILSQLNGVGLPVRTKRRYGVSFPKTWTAGTGAKFEVEVRDDLAPWNFQPRGSQDSIELISSEGDAIASAKVVNRNEVTFAEVEKIGLPVMSFDNFAEDGEVSHGITRLSVTGDLAGYKTRYSIKSHFPQLVTKKPITEKIEEDFNFAIKRLQARIDDLPDPRSERRLFKAPRIFEPETKDRREIFVGQTAARKLEIPVVITGVTDRGVDEYYASREVGRDIIWPRGADTAVKETADDINTKYGIASAIDGFLQVGMFAVYHYEEQDDGFFEHYFTGGVPLEGSRIVELTSGAKLVNGVNVADVRTLPTTVSLPVEFNDPASTQAVTPFEYKNVPYIDQTADVSTASVGDKIGFMSHGNKNQIAPGSDFGPAGDQNGDGFLYNVGGGGGEMDFAEVTVRPSSADGTGGAIRTITSTGGTIFTDGGTVGTEVFNIFFVGTDPKNVEVGDFCFVKRFREVGGAANEFRLYCAVSKATFMGTDALGG